MGNRYRNRGLFFLEILYSINPSIKISNQTFPIATAGTPIINEVIM